jgi:CheY-like chemotaxis protein
MIDIRFLLVFDSVDMRNLLRKGAATSSTPVDITESGSAASVPEILNKNRIDVILADAAMSPAERSSVIGRAKSVERKVFVFFLAASEDAARNLTDSGADGVIVRPENPDQARALIERCTRLRQPNRVLVVDDSSTMRNIVRKILTASPFQLEISDAQEGVDAIKQISTGKIDLVFLDYNMPGINGVETLHAIKRQHPYLYVALMTSAANDALQERARAFGADFFLKKPFFPADINAVLQRAFGARVQGA